jgi:hypothetical protein
VAIMQDDVANRLVRKLGLNTTQGKDAMKDFAKRTRALQGEGHPVDKAAIIAANEKFGAEFVPTRYNHLGESMEILLADIEKL